MKKILTVGCVVIALVANPVMAVDRTGSVQFKVAGTAVRPDDKITDVKVDTVGVPAAPQTRATDNFVPTVTAKYPFDLAGVKPYVGAGPAYFLWLTDKPGTTAQAIGVRNTNLINGMGAAL